MLTSLVAYIIFKEKLSKLDVACLFIGFIGVLLILLPKNQAVTSSLIDAILIITLPFHLTTLQMLIR